MKPKDGKIELAKELSDYRHNVSKAMHESAVQMHTILNKIAADLTKPVQLSSPQLKLKRVTRLKIAVGMENGSQNAVNS